MSFPVVKANATTPHHSSPRFVRCYFLHCPLLFHKVPMPPGAAATRDFYEVLRVLPDATADEIRKAYKKLVLQLHPDKKGQQGLSVLGHNQSALSSFQQVAEAYEVLSDEFRRLMYDAQRSAAAQSAEIERATLLAPRNIRGGSASTLPSDFYDRSNALWSEQFRERNGKLERRPLSRQSVTTDSRPPTGGFDGMNFRPSASPHTQPLLPPVVEFGDRPASRQSQTNVIGARQLFLRRSKNVDTPDLPPRPQSLPADPTVENDFPTFRPVLKKAFDATSPLKKLDRSNPAELCVSPEKRRKMSKQERSQHAASLRTLRLFFA